LAGGKGHSKEEKKRSSGNVTFFGPRRERRKTLTSPTTQ